MRGTQLPATTPALGTQLRSLCLQRALSGTAPVTVNFDALASSDPDARDNIASYTFNYGDGTSEVKNGPTASHTYMDSGVFIGSVRVNGFSWRGQQQPSEGSDPGRVDTQRRRVSGKAHRAAGTFYVNLPTSGPAGVESRNKGNTHTMSLRSRET